ILLTGEPGIGKSDVALRLIDEGAELVADDQTEISLLNGHLQASAPAPIAGLLEVRHIGLMRLPFCPSAPVKLSIELCPPNALLERLPEAKSILLLDQPVRWLRLPAWAASTPAKIRAALRYSIITDEM
ncbi:MAG: serine/threonine protein kinase, partial [Alphaproteobacteria bacterium]|nr:serine/threonine protein kinase [Alphaproteobacteria bacterium]